MTTWTDPPDEQRADQPTTIPDLIADAWRRFRGPLPNPYTTEETPDA